MNRHADHIESLEKIFRGKPQRLEWLSLLPSEMKWESTAVVLRNTTFETVEMGASPLSKFLGHKVHWIYSSYDASLPQIESLLGEKRCDLVVLWMDWSFLETRAPEEQKRFVNQTMERIADAHSGPILANLWKSTSPLQKILVTEFEKNARLIAIDVEEISALNGVAAFDTRSSEITKSCFSKEFDLTFARTLTCSIWPALAGAQLRGIIIDLDHTAYRGVLGEDGLDGIEFTPTHKRIWKRLAELKQQGFLLAISSKNDLEDVKRLLALPSVALNFEDFAVVAANWNSKAENIRTILTKFNFSPEYVLFIDDNPNELLNVKSEIPGLQVMRADSEGLATLLALHDYPGVRRTHTDSAAALRTADIQANEKRVELSSRMKGSKHDYLKELQIEILIEKDRFEVVERIADLAKKTNQFNLTFARTEREKIDGLLTEKSGHVYSLALCDRFSNSGVVGGALVEKIEELATFSEFLFSCRALGRDAETVFFQEMLKDLESEGITEVELKVVKGPKNQPAMDWLKTLDIGEGLTRLPIDEMTARCRKLLNNYPAKITWKANAQ